MNYNRILITGDAGRGKSTLASKLSARLQIPHHSTDDYFFEIKFSKPRDRQEALKEITIVFEQDKWIIEGTTAWLLEPGMKSADIILYLHYRNILFQWFTIFKRSLFRKNEDLKDTFALMRHVFYKRYGLGYKKGKMTHKEFVGQYQDKVVILSSFREIEDFVNSLHN